MDKHESYGAIRLNNVSMPGQGADLFGSSIKHENVLSITVYEASMFRKYAESNILLEKELMTVQLSSAQFTQFITSPNLAQGVPCTIIRFNGEGRESCPPSSVRQTLEEEMAKEVDKIMDTSLSLLQEVEEICEQKTPLKKSQQNELLQKLQKMHYDIKHNLPFLKSQVDRTLEESVASAKAEVEAFLATKMREHWQAFQVQQQPLIEGN